ncbi:unnamed protein product [Ranitomeya imitator]|uniref:Reverse transcriptase domain-containing protein n=1 Tax=Ranitomeya imitator TaxID=111125 RepID=A0ABN9L767_9NEOB|nr:unnamed protein product [Ranitomeya imitator]
MDMDLQKFYRSLRLKLHFADTDHATPPNLQAMAPIGITAASLGLRDKSTYQPPKGSHPLETFIQFVDKSFQKLRNDTDRGRIHYPSNLSVTERQALTSLKQEKDIIIKPADKGGAIVVMDKTLYKNEVYRQLSDTTTYKKLSYNSTQTIQDVIRTTLDGFQTRGILDCKTRAFLTKKHPITPVIYILPKIHKCLHNPPGRPIVASTDSILAPISIYLEKILTPLIRNTTSFLLDTGAFLETVRNISPVPPDAYLVSFDVKDLYTSIPHTNGIQSVRWLLTTNHMNPDLSDLCCELLSIVLNNNFFLFEDTYYLQIKGSAMGSNVAPPYANAYMAHYEDTSIYTQDLFRSHALTWKRYIDDVFCVWGGDLRTLQAFFQVLRTSWPGLDFTMTYDTHQISFLDTLVIKDDNGNLSTDLYSKPTDRNSLLHYSSFHPKNMIKSIPKSQLNRVSKIVSDPATKDLRTTEMRSKFRERGYPPRILDTAQANSTTRDRISATSRIPFVHQYHPAAYKLHRTIRQHWHILQEAYPTIQEFQHPFLPCFKRPRNIKDNLVRADIGPTHSGPTQRFLANPKMGTFPCLSCNQCNNVLRGNTIHHPHTGKRYPINNFFTCDTNYAVYLIKCPCGLLYVGETTQSVKSRISKHKSTIRCKNLMLPLPSHFIEKGHNLSQLRFQIIEQVTPPRRGGDRVTILKRREAYWIHELNTLSPKGLNRDYELMSFI